MPSTAGAARLACGLGRRPHARRGGQIDVELARAGLAVGRRLDAQLHDRRWAPLSVKSAKKLSGRSGNTVSPTFTVSLVTIRERDGDVLLRIARPQDAPGELERDHRQERRLADRDAVHLVVHVADHELAEAVLGLARGRRQRAAWRR